MASVLVIDDHRSIRTVLAMLLKELGHVVELAEDGQEGIEMLERSSSFDLVITDIRMPDKDGNDVARHIRTSRRSNIPVIAITAFPEEADRDLFDYIIIKPFRLEKLRTAIARFSECNLA